MTGEAPDAGLAPMRQLWRRVAFLHWRYPAETVQATLPAGLTVQTYDGDAWLSAVPLRFFTMDAARLPVVLASRAALGLPYLWATMSVRPAGNAVRYRGRRRWGAAAYDLTVRRREPIEASALDDFLTTRFRLYTRQLGRLIGVDVAHPPWRLCLADADGDCQDLLTAIGLPPPTGDPLVHAADDVPVRIGLPDLPAPNLRRRGGRRTASGRG
jgi:uncharacterized protein